MMKKKIYLGIDTSNYMTSICFISEEREVVYENRQLLIVEQGSRGLQQSQAVFQHIKNLPELFKKVKGIDLFQLEAVAVSKAPRSTEDSYMPVFLPGIAVAESLAATMSVPLYYTSHQEGHIAAGIYSLIERPKSQEFLAVHISGGTSELLLINFSEGTISIQRIGGTLDLHAGQLVDRIGVLLGLPFPAGSFLEQLAKKSADNFLRIPSSVKGYSFNLSGAESAAKRRLAGDENKENIARAIEHLLATSISKALKNALDDNFPKEILLVGGVAQNLYIQQQLQKKLATSKVGGKLFFAKREYSGDNAFGVANIALDQAQARNLI